MNKYYTYQQRICMLRLCRGEGFYNCPHCGRIILKYNYKNKKLEPVPLLTNAELKKLDVKKGD